jgi:transcriptional regulator with XRE-family HTH domain
MRAFRTEAGFTQVELGARTGLGKTTIGFLERGLRSPSLDSVAKIANALNVGVDALFTEGGVPESAAPLITNAVRALEAQGYTSAMKSLANFLSAFKQRQQKDVPSA